MNRSVQLAVLAALALSALPARAFTREVPLLIQTIANSGPITVGTTPRGLAFDGTFIWAANYDSSTVSRVDGWSKQVVQTINLPANSVPASVVFDGTNVWVFGAKAYKYDKTGASKITNGLALSGSAWGAAFDGTSIWVSTTGGLDKINITTNARTTVTVPVTNGAVAWDGTAVWVSNIDLGIVRYDPATGKSAPPTGTVATGNAMNHLVFDGVYLWVLADQAGLAQKIDVTTGALVATVAINPDGRGGAFDGSTLWVATKNADMIQRIDVHTNQLFETFQVPAGTGPYNCVFDGTHMWIAGQGATRGTLQKFLVRFN